MKTEQKQTETDELLELATDQSQEKPTTPQVKPGGTEPRTIRVNIEEDKKTIYVNSKNN